ncbi:uncharacterized protein BX663DRAFT_493557 [Cokeromyces recurvatus]|uniref:uncharacterized protein n=1 Tax=Cokeromyces recurvatus TaxID=90255 RepID=UPI00222076F9|nr:uncharacterized protein BX663DRAFT_493557 [Cokeromyces recurvatus]KAI7908265.1 transmembrane protein [Cokeromyces recurvatus]
MSLIGKIGAIVEACSYNFKPGNETDFSDSLGGSWYVSPAAHGIEFLIIVPFYLIMTVYFGYKAIILNKKNYNTLINIKKTVRPKRSWFETMCLIIMILSYTVTVIHKLISHTNYFLLQPCHVSAVILIIIMSWPDNDYQYIPQLLFNVYLHTLWGSVLALVFPDLRDHDLLGEVFNFFLEHVLILVLPFYMLTTKRYVILSLNINMALFSFFLYASYHSPFLHAISLWSGFNINYTLVTPAIGFLIVIGHWYRFAMYGAAFILMFLTRYIVVELFLKTFNIRITEKKKSS